MDRKVLHMNMERRMNRRVSVKVRTCGIQLWISPHEGTHPLALSRRKKEKRRFHVCLPYVKMAEWLHLC